MGVKMDNLSEILIESANERNLFTLGKYLTQGEILVYNDSQLVAPIFRYFKRDTKNLKKVVKQLPKGKGQPYELPAEVELLKNHVLAFRYNNSYCFNYDYVKNIIDATWLSIEDLTFFVAKNKKSEPGLKIYKDNLMIGAIYAIKDKKEK